MADIRAFQNSDLPEIFEVWMRHWSAARHNPPVSVSILERAVLGRSFFRSQDLLVALADNRVIAWAHSFLDADAGAPASSAEVGDTAASPTGTIAAICFADEPGLAVCDQLLQAAEANLRAAGAGEIRVGPVRDDRNGYAGLAPIGHGIGVPVSDARTGSLLSRNGFHVLRSVDRMLVQTSTYRPPVNREFLQMRRSTRLDHVPILPTGERVAAAMSHFDIERSVLVDHQNQQPLAMCEMWMGDPEVQVMESSRAILSLSQLNARRFNGMPLPTAPESDPTSEPGELTLQQQFLISALVQSLSNRQVLSVETAVDRDDQAWITQLKGLKFECVEQGKQWVKD